MQTRIKLITKRCGFAGVNLFGNQCLFAQAVHFSKKSDCATDVNSYVILFVRLFLSLSHKESSLVLKLYKKISLNQSHP